MIAGPAFPEEGRSRTLLVTGGAGFVGSNLALAFKARYPGLGVVCLDNLRRWGSELNPPRLVAAGVRFVHGDVREEADLEAVGEFDVLLECSAEPSVLAGYGPDRRYLVDTNLGGTVNCVEAALRNDAKLLFLSTSRVYPIATLESLAFIEDDTRFVLAERQEVPGASPAGIAEDFPLDGARSLYGATKLCSELLIAEYGAASGLQAVVNRCGVIAGPWQMGKVDQGVAAHWLLQHVFGGELRYIGFGGSGKQVRDFLHVDDLFDLLELELADFGKVAGGVFNAGGGADNAASLLELTELCREITGRQLPVEAEAETRPGDVRVFVTDDRRIRRLLDWAPKRPVRRIFEDLHAWILEHADDLERTLRGTS